MSRPVVIVLAGGASNRLWPLRDKLFLEFGSMSLLERHLRALSAAGCERFVIISRPDTQDAVTAVSAAAGVQADVAIQPEPRGMADAILCASPILDDIGDAPVYVTQAHDVVDAGLHVQMLDRWANAPAGVSGLIAAVQVESYFPGGYLKLDGERITDVVEKPGAGNEPSNLVNLVAHVFASWRPLLTAIAAEQVFPGGDDAYERGLSRLMQAGEFRPVTYTGRWQALKYPWHVLDVMELLLERWTEGLESPGPDYEQREDGVFIGRDVRIFPGAYVVAPALIGHGCVIGHNALVRGSVLGARSVAGFGSEVARSYLGENVQLHHNYAGDSVLDRDSAMGYGAVTANYRIDGRTVPMYAGPERIDTGRMKLGLVLGAGARLGVNTSTMPGVKIGAGAMVGANLRISRDVPDGARVLTEADLGSL
jgi:bifunctional UDP-N-acetylglucosamine pyrophosphorylase/glucosamine-1-phosphate N-acetyltransferase